jgi:broad specificity phosphatase PhoE
VIVAAVFRALIKLGQNVSETNRRRTNPLRAAVLGIMSVALGLICANWEQPSLASELAWQALQEGGAVALLRHAHAPGTGDPPEFRLGDCSTQRNLSSEGREQARRIGEQFQANHIPIERVLSSEWCRCLETARLAFGDRVEPVAALNSFFSTQDAEGAQTRAVRALVEGWRAQSGVLVLVTHQVNITALTGLYPAEGEILVLKPRAASGFDLAARFRP